MHHFNCWRSVPLPCGQYIAIFKSFAARGVCPAAGELRNGDSAQRLPSGKTWYRISEKLSKVSSAGHHHWGPCCCGRGKRRGKHGEFFLKCLLILEVNLRFFCYRYRLLSSKGTKWLIKDFSVYPISSLCNKKNNFKLWKMVKSNLQFVQDPGILLCAKSQQAQPFLPDHTDMQSFTPLRRIIVR